MSDIAIETERLVKYYGGRRILNGINLKVPKGCIYGLLGRNGVGKTTLIRILLGMEQPTRGTSQVLGVDSMSLPSQVKGRIAYVAEGHHLIQGYRVERLIRLCRSLALQWNQSFFEHLIKAFNLPMDRKIKALSTGMRAQLNLALAMATDPEVLILDDPTLGLDTIQKMFSCSPKTEMGTLGVSRGWEAMSGWERPFSSTLYSPLQERSTNSTRRLPI